MRDITSGSVCPYTAVAYVTDFCGSTGTNGRLLAYGITTGASPAITKTDSLTLPTGCKPSTVTWHEGTGQLFVLCQEGESIIPVTLINACNLNALGTEVALKYVKSVDPLPSCTQDTMLSSCIAAVGDVDCTPHDFAWISDPAVYDNWLFVTLDNVNQVIAVLASNPTFQAGFYGHRGPPTPFEPLEIEVLEYP